MSECTCEGLRELLLRIIELLESKSPRRKRSPSPYNLFMGECVRSGKSFKECAAEWRSRKTSGS